MHQNCSLPQNLVMVGIEETQRQVKKLNVGHRQVRKNNGVVLEGLLVFSPDQNLAPTIYLDRFLEAYRSGMTFQEVVQFQQLRRGSSPHLSVGLMHQNCSLPQNLVMVPAGRSPGCSGRS